ncbi:RNA methyltransferase [Variovorax sp. OV329]|uniref:TrmH family RNA methyltransferase n=1 Tax=Variovorax sp. OV329 TaxID=1882825 RepID=UPI0008F13B77|nr:RNA methyltransferase [Variovorax sp. OV329]SFM45091.1 RNA methyltransferase, TrmH family [Variovorax sp. OV329]
MTSPDITTVSSRDNPLLKDLRRLAQDPGAYRKLGKVWLEGDHLCRAARERGVRPAIAVFTESYWGVQEAQWRGYARKTVLLPDALLHGVSGLESPAPMGFVIDTPAPPEIQPTAPTIVLDRLQDAGNVGSILRSGAAFGFQQVIALKGTAALWAPKVLRAGMGAHFGLRLIESAAPEVLDALQLPLLATSSHGGQWLHEAHAQKSLPNPCAWLMGHEGQGVSPELQQRATQLIRIAQPGGEESLNVAAAAAICLHASAAVSLRSP